MKFKIDENLPALVRERLSTAGFDAVTVLDQRLGGQSDNRIASVCANEERILVTCDADFGNILVYPPQAHAGVILLNSSDQSVPVIMQLLDLAIRTLSKEQISKRLWIVEERRIRIRGE